MNKMKKYQVQINDPFFEDNSVFQVLNDIKDHLPRLSEFLKGPMYYQVFCTTYLSK